MRQLKVLLFIIIVLFNFRVSAQTLKLYQGSFEGIRYTTGKAEYTYFEDENQERIFSGKYTYRRGSLTVIGQFHNNIKVGIWTYTCPSSTSYGSSNEKLTGNYIGGKMEGKLNCSSQN